MENKILAVVNGKEITQQDLDLASMRFEQDKQQFLATEQGKRQLLEQLIAWELLFNHAKDSGLEEKEQYKAQLEEAKRGILTQMAVEDLFSSIDVTDEEANEYYDNNKKMFAQGEQISAKHILVDSKEKADEVLEAIKGGMTFEEAAQLYSSCPSKSQGGSLGTFGKGMMVPEFEKAAFELEVGTISEPVKTQFGYHIIVVDEKVPAQEKQFDEVKDMIKSHMVQDKQNSTYVSFIESLRNKYSVLIK